MLVPRHGSNAMPRLMRACCFTGSHVMVIVVTATGSGLLKRGINSDGARHRFISYHGASDIIGRCRLAAGHVTGRYVITTLYRRYIISTSANTVVVGHNVRILRRK